MSLQEDINKAKKAISDATFELSQRVDAAVQVANEAQQRKNSLDAEISKDRLQLVELSKSVLALKDEKANLEAAVGDLKAFLEKHLKVGA